MPPDPGADAREQRQLDELMAVSQAEGVVTSARQLDLVAAEKSARRRLSAARGLLTRARKDGSAARIAAAAQRVADADAEWERISDAGIAGMSQISRARLDNLGGLLDQVGRTWDAQAEAMEARHGGRRAA
jgi:hypothetical protein